MTNVNDMKQYIADMVAAGKTKEEVYTEIDRIFDEAAASEIQLRDDVIKLREDLSHLYYDLGDLSKPIDMDVVARLCALALYKQDIDIYRSKNSVFKYSDIYEICRQTFNNISSLMHTVAHVASEDEAAANLMDYIMNAYAPYKITIKTKEDNVNKDDTTEEDVVTTLNNFNNKTKERECGCGKAAAADTSSSKSDCENPMKQSSTGTTARSKREDMFAAFDRFLKDLA